MAIINGTTNFWGVNQSDTLNGTASDDTINADPGTFSAVDTVNAGDGNDVIYGGGSNDILNGEAGNDTIYGELGNDSMSGGEGADTYVVTPGAGDDTINNFSNDENTDVLRLSGFLPGAINNTVRDGDDLLINYGLLGDSIRLTNFYLSSAYRHLTLEFDGGVFVDVNDLAQGDTITGSGTLTGTAFADTITGSATDDTLIGNAGNDVLNAQGGADTLDGGAGVDLMAGGTGDDTYVVDVSSDVVTELVGGGSDTVTSANLSLELNLGSYSNVEHATLTGSADLNLTGDANGNLLTGNAGDNILTGNAGNDVLNGDAGNDTIYGELGNDSMSGGEGADTYVVTSVLGLLAGDDTINNFSNDENTDVLRLSGFLPGNINNTVRDGDDLLINYGLLGDSIRLTNFYLSSAYRHLTLEFEGGVFVDVNDLAQGETITGSGTLTGTAFADTITGSATDDTLIGNAGNDVLNAQGGADTLDGGAGVDLMAGGTGDDTYVVDVSSDVVTELVGGGSDTVTSANLSLDLNLGSYSNVEHATLTGSADLNLTGDANANALTGNAGDNILTGNAGNDVLDGGAGTDTLIGGLGNDSMSGGEGADTYVVTSVLGFLAGDDTINNFSNDENTDVLRLSGFFPGDINNTVRDGDDLLINYGLLGDSIRLTNFYLSSAYRHLTLEFDGGGFVDVNDLAQGETITGSGTLTGTDFADTITGSATDDTLIGNAGNDVLNAQGGADTLDGGAGNDTLIGGDGNDTYIVDSSGDVITELPNQGSDTVQSDVMSLDLGSYSNVEHATLTGSADLNLTGDANANALTGNAGDNILTGNAGNDVLDGGAGTDTLIGGLGNDSMSGGEGADTYVVTSVLGLLAGNDTINNFSNDETTDILRLSGFVPGDINNTVRDGDDLLINYGLLGDSIRLTNFYLGSAYRHLTLEFDGGVFVDVNDLAQGETITGSGTLTGTAFADTITGSATDDTLIGNAGNDVLNAQGGADTLDGGAGVDLMAGGTGDDTYVVDVSSDVVTELVGGGSDTVTSANLSLDLNLGSYSNVEHATLTGSADLNLTGDANGNLLTGNAGDNILTGNAGNDVLDGGAGNDTIYGELGNDSMSGGEGADTYVVTSPLGGSGNDTINNFSNDETTDILRLSGFVPGDINNTVRDGDDLLINYGLLGDSIRLTNFYLGSAYRHLTLEFDGGVFVDVNDLAQGDTITGSGTLTGTDFDDTITGSATDDTLIGNAGNDVLNAQGGADTLDGGAGVDLMAGGTGDDTYVVDVSSDVVTELVGEGSDTVQSDVMSLDLGSYSNVEHATLTGSADLNLTGDANANALTGNAGDNILTGNAGNDVLDGGAGTDTLIGGLGDDTYVVDSTLDTITENLGEGTDTVQSADISLDLNVYTEVENATLLGGNQLDATGNSGNNVLTGNSGDNTLDGGAGNDTLIGGDGDDTYLLDSIGDSVIEAANQGNDTVVSASINLDLANYANVEHAALTGSSGLSLTGDSNANTLTGNSGNNTLDGGLGHDLLIGGGGDDTLIGGDGDDTYVVDSSTDILIENAAAGTDTVQSADISLNLSLYSNIEHASLLGSSDLNLTGDSNDNVLIGNSGNNTLDGGAGNDTLIGGDGNDTYIVDNSGDVITELPNQGSDTVQSDVISLDLNNYSNVEHATLTGSANLNLSGDTAANILTGNSGNNTLDGGAGDDTLLGGEGDDTYIVDSSSDVISELANQGLDTVQSDVMSLDLGSYSNVEHATLTGSANLNLSGDTAANILTGNSGNNTLDGGAGDDTLLGGEGDDVYTVDDLTDSIVELADQGSDTVQSADLSLDLLNYANVESALLLGSAHLNLTGNTSNNTLTGNSGNNTLDGSAGNDTLIGGDGDDLYIIDSTNDIVIEGQNGGTDTIQSETVSIDLLQYANVEHATLTGSSNLNITGSHDAANILTGNAGNNMIIGNALSDTLIGNDGDDTLDGSGGKDIMIGGLGNDTYYMSTLGDQVTELSNQGTDTVIAGFSYTLGAHVENLTLTGSGDLEGTGNVHNNILMGTSGNNILLGGGGVDQLYGGDGADLLNGGTNIDSLYGGDGNDTYYINLNGDQVFEQLNEGVDTVNSLVDYTLGNHVENLILGGTDHLKANGNALDNQITGNSGNNLINGGLGNNLLTGGAGNDQYRLNRDFGTNTVVEGTAGGSDTIQFGLGVLREQVWLSRVDDDLVLQIIGTNANMVVQDWYSGGANVEQFRLLSGRTLMAADVDTLVNAMASLTPPAFGETTLSTATKTALGSVFINTWNTIT